MRTTPARSRIRIPCEVLAGLFFAVMNTVLTMRTAELINLVKHMQAYPDDPLEVALRNIFDFDVYRRETIEKLSEILDHHGFVH